MYANYIKHCMDSSKHHVLGLKNYEVLSSNGVSKTQRLTRPCFYIVKVVTLFSSFCMWMIFSLL